jgi:hypothetical protein
MKIEDVFDFQQKEMFKLSKFDNLEHLIANHTKSKQNQISMFSTKQICRYIFDSKQTFDNHTLHIDNFSKIVFSTS